MLNSRDQNTMPAAGYYQRQSELFRDACARSNDPEMVAQLRALAEDYQTLAALLDDSSPSGSFDETWGRMDGQFLIRAAADQEPLSDLVSQTYTTREPGPNSSDHR